MLAYGIGNIKVYTITSWQLLFLFLGAITAVVALVMLVLLPDSIQKTVFLNKHERKVAEYRILKSKAGADETGVFMGPGMDCPSRSTDLAACVV